MSVRHDHFVCTVAELSRAAALGALTLDFELASGRTVSGVPTSSDVDEQAVRLSGATIELSQVLAVRVSAPEG